MNNHYYTNERVRLYLSGVSRRLSSREAALGQQVQIATAEGIIAEQNL